MNKKTLIISALAAALIVFASLSSVVGSNVADSDEKKTGLSPLFAVRSRRSVCKENTVNIDTSYVGKGKILNLFLSRQSSLQQMLNRAIKLIETKPEILNVIADKFEANPKIAELLSENEINIDEVKHQLNQIKNDPSLLRQSIDESAISLPL